MEKVRLKCGFANVLDVGAFRSKGGLSISWKEEYMVQLRSFSANHINVDVKEGKGMPSWRLTRFYGASEEHKKESCRNF
ncbi:hypothetical protein PVK06_027842 [Gossypium arboreum]|uniref:Uncharacterized protein n=1 Tax=Gossypium arboreum TaxID=29729 RepID=A0ABR0P3U6_GOSAR|nr:hypothetical protein PVK06_027842 [Gossypium arboreum]